MRSDLGSKPQEIESMKRSTDRILTTHMGSLPRPDVLAQFTLTQEHCKIVHACSNNPCAMSPSRHQ